MVGIVSYGAYIPKYRIDRKIIYKAMGWLNPATYMPGEKAVANFDEDSITMGVAAGMDCLTDIDRNIIDAFYFASTTNPYKERQSAEIVATACDLNSDMRSADFGHSLKDATTAMLAASDGVMAGSLSNVMVCASDCRIGKPGSAQEEIFGDGAASVIIGNDNVIAELKGSCSVSHDFPDHWRGDMDKFDRQWEDRFIRDVGYSNFLMDTIGGLMKKCGIEPKDISKVAYPCLYAGDHKKIGKKLGFEPAQVQEPLLYTVGYTGTSDPMLMLVKMLEEAKPGDKIIVASFGSGSDALLFEVTDGIKKVQSNRKGVAKHLASKHELKSYEKMAVFNKTLPAEMGIRGAMAVLFISFSEMWRSRKQMLGLCGTKCTKCGTPQFPLQRICVNPDCGAVDHMEEYRFSDREATLFTYTADSLACTPSPPAFYGIANFDGGGRYWFDLTDVEFDDVKVGMKIQMSFRKKYVDDKFLESHIYFWKMIPVME